VADTHTGVGHRKITPSLYFPEADTHTGVGHRKITPSLYFPEAREGLRKIDLETM